MAASVNGNSDRAWTDSKALQRRARPATGITLVLTAGTVMWRQVKKDEYDEFFKLTFKEFLEPLATAHFNVEGTIEFRALMFVPGMAPFEQQVTEASSGIPAFIM
jgi:Hsp90 protein